MQKIGDIPNTRADSHGEFTDGNVAGGVPPTILPAEWFNTLQRELMSVLSAADIDADSAQFNQVATAISKLISNGIDNSDFLQAANHLKEIKNAGPTAVAETLANLGLGDILKITDIKALLDIVFPVGIPLPYPLSDIPMTVQGIVWFKMNGGTFNTAIYPKLALKYPSGVLPDLRGEFIRGWDDGRGINANRTILSHELDELKSHQHLMSDGGNAHVRVGVTGGSTQAWFGDRAGMDVRTGWAGGTETRPRNIAFNYIVRAA
ncbi:phage tail protein [Yersinia enterocolitica]|uniref:phage tail protein n=1 Tax=Yersinia enterocolitica TaxID=630 RepID=UPI00398D5317